MKSCNGTRVTWIPVGEEEDSHLGDFLADDDIPSPSDSAAQTLLKEELNEVLKTLSDREARVLRLRFDLTTAERERLKKSAESSKLQESVSDRSKRKALRKLRHPSRSKRLATLSNKKEVTMEENFRQVVDGKKGLYMRHGRCYISRQPSLPGAKEFVQWLNENGKNYLFLTNSSGVRRVNFQKLAARAWCRRRAFLHVGYRNRIVSCHAEAGRKRIYHRRSGAYQRNVCPRLYDERRQPRLCCCGWKRRLTVTTRSQKAARLVLAGAKLIGHKSRRFRAGRTRNFARDKGDNRAHWTGQAERMRII